MSTHQHQHQHEHQQQHLRQLLAGIWRQLGDAHRLATQLGDEPTATLVHDARTSIEFAGDDLDDRGDFGQ